MLLDHIATKSGVNRANLEQWNEYEFSVHFFNALTYGQFERALLSGIHLRGHWGKIKIMLPSISVK